ncbi:hypothetical protein EDC61_10452 [Sulfuritortus calidifontis]|uniref:Uncharacterized protein n=1 Tax=Sulfuritortus calidifontis TaxID=1914471 RepID=A0A4V2UQT7_9PROT|nr:hypothetical protein [Sulfuritortus calidifontis]TCS72642.1 hypothetical protein EDC61_10452 [Sulfuritortus calidifontis]
MLINLTIMIAVQFSQRLITVGCLLSIGKQSLRAKKLPAGINRSIAIEIANKKAILAIHPAGLFGKTVAVMVKIRTTPQVSSSNSIPIQV